MVKKPQPRRARSGDERRTVRCAIYTRVSTYDQSRKDYSSLDTQREYCRKFIELMNATENWVEVGVFSDTEVRRDARPPSASDAAGANQTRPS